MHTWDLARPSHLNALEYEHRVGQLIHNNDNLAHYPIDAWGKEYICGPSHDNALEHWQCGAAQIMLMGGARGQCMGRGGVMG